LRSYAKGDPARLVVLRGYDDLGSAVLGIVSGEARPAAPGSMTIADLPLVTLPTPTPGPIMAIFYSGDGGWRDLDKQIGKNLQASGIPVVGFDTLRFFWDRRTPEEAANSLAVAIGHFSRAWNTPNVLLVGYSFGADMLPFAVNRLPEAERGKIRADIPACARHCRRFRDPCQRLARRLAARRCPSDRSGTATARPASAAMLLRCR
jgi:hypothetical protein